MEGGGVEIYSRITKSRKQNHHLHFRTNRRAAARFFGAGRVSLVSFLKGFVSLSLSLSLSRRICYDNEQADG